MFCKKCGQQSGFDKKFCTNCGTAFSTPQQYSENVNTEPSPIPVIRPPMPKEPWTTKKIIKTILVTIFFGGIILLKFGLGAVNSLDNTAITANNSAQESYQSGGDANQIISQLEQAYRDAITNDTKMTTKVNLAYVYSSEGKNDLALNTFREALTFSSEGTSDFYLISGEIALLEGRPDLALIAYNKAYEKEPTNFQVNNALNLFYLDTSDERPKYSNYTKALTYALKANELQSSEITKQNLAIAYYFNENYKQAISLFLSINNISSQPYLAYWLGLSYARDNQSDNAKRYLQIAIDGGVEAPEEVTNYIKSN